MHSISSEEDFNQFKNDELDDVSISLEMIVVLNQIIVMVRMPKKLVVNTRQTQMVLSLQLMVRDYTLAWLAI